MTPVAITTTAEIAATGRNAPAAVRQATGRCEVRPHSYVFRVELSTAGRATGVLYYDENKREQRQKARAVVLRSSTPQEGELQWNYLQKHKPYAVDLVLSEELDASNLMMPIVGLNRNIHKTPAIAGAIA